MSDKADDLRKALELDLSQYLSDYQLCDMRAGKPLWPDATLDQARCYALGQSLLKKYSDSDDPSPDACAKALGKFIESNKLCESWALRPVWTYQEVIIGTVKKWLDDFWYANGSSLFSSFEEIFSTGSLGSGSNIHARGTDWYTKLFDGPLTYCGKDLPFVWEHLCARDPRWDDAERLRRSRYGMREVQGNKLSFVNKNVTVARSICTEPTLNMWFQLGIGWHLEERLRTFAGIDITNQSDINGQLAEIGSRTGRFATIDLESASDSVSLGLLREILPSPMMEWLTRFRSPSCTLPNGECVELSMISSMGNGYTFPLETIIFTAVVAACYSVKGIPLRRYGKAEHRNFGVFGDDIIVESGMSRLVIETLQLFGFRVNRSKTFVEGPFRESCGQDYFNGHWCRGIYIKKLRVTQDSYIAINTLNRWSARTGIELPTLVSHLYRWCHRRLFVPPVESDDAGIHVPLDKVRGKLKCLPHGIREYRISSPDRYGILLSLDDRMCADKGLKPRQMNPSGLHLIALRGDLKGTYKTSKRGKKCLTGYFMGCRQQRLKYTTKRRISSSWDYLPPESRFSLIGWPRWSDAVLSNLPAED